MRNYFRSLTDGWRNLRDEYRRNPGTVRDDLARYLRRHGITDELLEEALGCLNGFNTADEPRSIEAHLKALTGIEYFDPELINRVTHCYARSYRLSLRLRCCQHIIGTGVPTGWAAILTECFLDMADKNRFSYDAAVERLTGTYWHELFRTNRDEDYSARTFYLHLQGLPDDRIMLLYGAYMIESELLRATLQPAT